MWRRRIMSFFRGSGETPTYEPITPMSVAPADVPNPRLELQLDAGRARLDNHVASAERTVASLYHQFAEQAASKTRR